MSPAIRLIEQHRLIGGDIACGILLRRAAEDLRLPLGKLLLQEHVLLAEAGELALEVSLLALERLVLLDEPGKLLLEPTHQRPVHLLADSEFGVLETCLFERRVCARHH